MGKKPMQVAIGIGIAIVSYIIFRQIAKSLIKPTSPAKVGDSSFAGADGSSSYAAMYYDDAHANDDGSLGATWIGYNNSPIVGFWKKGRVAEGTQVSV